MHYWQITFNKNKEITSIKRPLVDEQQERCELVDKQIECVLKAPTIGEALQKSTYLIDNFFNKKEIQLNYNLPKKLF